MAYRPMPLTGLRQQAAMGVVFMASRSEIQAAARERSLLQSAMPRLHPTIRRLGLQRHPPLLPTHPPSPSGAGSLR
jgi:hypothetical protein